MSAREAEPPRWTQAMERFLVRMQRRGRTYAWIARALRVPRAACVARAEALGLWRRAPTGWRRPLARTVEPAPIGPMCEVLEPGRCHWIAGDPAARDWRMCGHPSVHGTPWCAHHLARVLVRGREAK